MRRFRLAVLGGTFDHLHIGHHALLASAFGVGDEVAIGVTTDRFVARHPKPVAGRMQPYAARRSTWSGGCARTTHPGSGASSRSRTRSAVRSSPASRSSWSPGIPIEEGARSIASDGVSDGRPSRS